jgi:hypothetical protein
MIELSAIVPTHTSTTNTNPRTIQVLGKDQPALSSIFSSTHPSKYMGTTNSSMETNVNFMQPAGKEPSLYPPDTVVELAGDTTPSASLSSSASSSTASLHDCLRDTSSLPAHHSIPPPPPIPTRPTTVLAPAARPVASISQDLSSSAAPTPQREHGEFARASVQLQGGVIRDEYV